MHRSKHHHAHSVKLRKKYPRWHRRKKRPRVRKKKRKRVGSSASRRAGNQSFLKRVDDGIMTMLGYDAPPGFRRLYMQPYRPPPRG